MRNVSQKNKSGERRGHHPLLGSRPTHQSRSTGLSVVDDSASHLSERSTSSLTLNADLSPARVIYVQPDDQLFVTTPESTSGANSPKRTKTTMPTPLRNGSHRKVHSEPECIDDLGEYKTMVKKQPRLRSKSIHDPYFEAALKRHFPHQLPPSGDRLTLFERVKLASNQVLSTLISTILLIGVVLWAMGEDLLKYVRNKIIHPIGMKFLLVLRLVPLLGNSNARAALQRQLDIHFGAFISEHGPSREEEEIVAHRLKSQSPTINIDQYAEEIGFRIEHHTFETRDGFYLKMHRVLLPEKEQRSHVKSPPMLILHGMFQCSGAFVTNEEDSMAFVFARLGFDVWLGNNRGIFGAGHREYSRSDPRFWNWNLLELARYDFPAMITGILAENGADKVAVVGHSQGSASAFVGLSRGIDPGLGNKVSAFIALAPAVFTGPLLTGFPFNFLRTLDRRGWSRYFGDLEFLPQMDPFMQYAPVWAAKYLGYLLFAWLFNWSDETWIKARKAKYFRFTPTCSSSENIYWWTGGSHGFAYRGCIFADDKEPWFDASFPPLLSLYGQKDALCLGSKLVDRLVHHEPALRGRFASIMLPGEQHMLHLSANAAKGGGLHDCMIDFLRRTGAIEEETG